MTAEQAELIEKLNCLEFETSQLNHAYQQWRSHVEQGTVPDWMAAAIRITYEALIMLCLDSSRKEIESDALNGEVAPMRRALPAEDNVTALCVRNGQPFQYEHAETDPPVHFTALVDGSVALTPLRQQNRIVGMLALADAPPAFSARRLPELQAAACELSCNLEEESATAEAYPEVLSISEPDWSGAEMAIAISPPATDEVTSQQLAIQQRQQDIQQDRQQEKAEPVMMQSLATLRLPDWLQGSTSKFFGAFSLGILGFVAILMVTGGVLGIYLANPQRASLKAASVATQTSAERTEVGAVATPTGATAEFKFDPDPVVTALGSSFVLNAVLSRGSDIGSVGVQIDYDANLLQFMGVSQGGFLVKAGRNFVLAQRDDPLSGVLKISAEQSPGIPGISGEGAVFALAFQARKKGKATVSITPGAHDSQGRRIEIAGSQVTVRVN